MLVELLLLRLMHNLSFTMMLVFKSFVLKFDHHTKPCILVSYLYCVYIYTFVYVLSSAERDIRMDRNTKLIISSFYGYGNMFPSICLSRHLKFSILPVGPVISERCGTPN